MILNFSNQPKSRWSDKQREAAEQYGEMLELAFPKVLPDLNQEQVTELADKYMEKIMAKIDIKDTVFIQGEFTLTYAMVKRLRERGISVVSACFERQIVEHEGENGEVMRDSRFVFRQFREYE